MKNHMLIITGVLLVAHSGLRAAEKPKPNVLFIMADDLRAETGSYGSSAITPNLDRLAKMSVQFDRAYCQQAVCNPSRSSLLTGRRPDSLQVWNNSTHFREPNPDVTTIPLWFKDHGYHIGEHTLWGKTSNFELDARVPMLIRAPGISQADQKSHSIAELMDLFPTLTELCDLPAPESLEGTSLVPVLRDPSKSVKQAAFTQHPRPASYDRTPSKQPESMGVSVRTAKVRYTEWRDWKTGETTARELYTDADEPAETQSLIDAPSTAVDQREAAELLRRQVPLAAHP